MHDVSNGASRVTSCERVVDVCSSMPELCYGTRRKVRQVLTTAFHPKVLELDTKGGISGFLVFEEFVGIDVLQRQRILDDTLAQAGLDREERRQVVIISALTPDEAEFRHALNGNG